MERTFYEDPEVCVTSNRLIVHGTTVSLEDVTSVEQTIDEPARIGLAAIFMVAGLVGTLIALGLDHAAVAFALLVGAVLATVWVLVTRQTYTISLVTASESMAVLRSHNQEFAYAVLGAIREAIASRRLDRPEV